MDDERPPFERAVDPDAAQRLRELFATWPSPPYRPPVVLVTALLAVVVLMAASMPLQWFHRYIPAHEFHIVHGYNGANWLLVVALLVLAAAVRVALRPPSGYVVFFFMMPWRLRMHHHGHRPGVASCRVDGGGDREMTVVATGSIAFDYILSYSGRFRDHILLDKTHILNLSFLVDRLEKRRGGVAANYAYNLALLGYPSAILATAGRDADEYHSWLAARGIDVNGLRLLDDVMTATGFTTTDSDDNQLTGYYGGAMLHADILGLDDTVRDPEVVLIGPNGPTAMARLVRECRERGVRWLYDPSHQLSTLSADDLRDGIRGAWMLIGNDYELELIQERTGRDVAALLEECEMVVTTRGRHGSQLATRDGTVEAGAAPATVELDPTGAGDAYRAGLVAGLLRGLELDDAARVASLAAAYVVEQTGTVEHVYTQEEFASRFQSSFDRSLPAELFTRREEVLR